MTSDNYTPRGPFVHGCSENVSCEGHSHYSRRFFKVKASRSHRHLLSRKQLKFVESENEIC